MENAKKISLGALLLTGALVVAGSTGVFAAEKIGTVTGADGDVKNKVSMTAELTAVDGSQVSFKDTETNSEYQASFGPSRYTREYQTGETVEVVGVETDASGNDKGHNFQVMEVDGTVLRESFEGKPAWAGVGNGGERMGQGSGERAGQGQMRSGNGSTFIDADGDGNCDNAN